MTCIVAYKKDGVVYMGGDSAGVSGIDVRIRRDEKVFKNGQSVFGFTSSFRMGNILRYQFTMPDHPEELSDDAYMNTIFIDAIIKILHEHKYAREDSNTVRGGVFLVGYHGDIWLIDSDFQVGKVKDNYDSVGCGMYYALGCLYNCDKNDDPKKIVKDALKTAAYFSGGVSAPFNIVSA